MKLLDICVTLDDVWNIVDIKFKDKSENIEIETLFISPNVVKEWEIILKRDFLLGFFFHINNFK